MNGIEFVKMMKQDIATVSDANKHDLEAVVEVMEFVVNQNLGCDVPTQRPDGAHVTPQDCYEFLQSNAKKSAGNRPSYLMTHGELIKLVAEYLGLNTASEAPQATRPVIDLEDLF